MSSRKILIHHHATIYIDPVTGDLFTFSFIGLWLNALSEYFDEVGLLFHVTKEKLVKQDTVLRRNKFRLFSLGAPGRTWDRIERIRRIKKVCAQASKDFDTLLIRGITPRQYTIYKALKVPNKYFLLVGSLVESKPAFGFKFHPLYNFVLFYIRRKELALIGKGSKMLANSPQLVCELQKHLGINARFIPTSSITQAMVRPLRLKQPGNPLRLLFCGRIVRDKGIFELLEAVYVLNQREQRVRLTLIGELAEDMQREIASLSFWKEIRSQIEFTGFIPFSIDLLDRYDCHDLYILPSYHEGFPHSIWEAAATSTPIITTAVGGIPGIVGSEEVFFIDKYSSGSIVNAVEQASNHWSSTGERVSAAYKLLQSYTVEQTASTLNQVINE
jgi:glycosyltransferase involved in cell wall biosynthesis